MHFCTLESILCAPFLSRSVFWSYWWLYRSYALRRVRDAFKEHKATQDKAEINELLDDGLKNLEIIKRQVVISKLYRAADLVIEKQLTQRWECEPSAVESCIICALFLQACWASCGHDRLTNKIQQHWQLCGFFCRLVLCLGECRVLALISSSKHPAAWTTPALVCLIYSTMELAWPSLTWSGIWMVIQLIMLVYVMMTLARRAWELKITPRELLESRSWVWIIASSTLAHWISLGTLYWLTLIDLRTL